MFFNFTLKLLLNVNNILINAIVVSFLTLYIMNDYYALDTYEKIHYFVKVLPEITTRFPCKNQLRQLENERMTVHSSHKEAKT